MTADPLKDLTSRVERIEQALGLAGPLTPIWRVTLLKSDTLDRAQWCWGNSVVIVVRAENAAEAEQVAQLNKVTPDYPFVGAVERYK